MKNYYEDKRVKKFVTEGINPHYDDTHIKIDTRSLIVAASGQYKTNALINYIALAPDTFAHVHIVYKEEEPLYSFLKEQLKGSISFYDDINKLPKLNNINDGYDKTAQQLVVFDDQINADAARMAKVSEYYIRGRKKKLTIIFIAQSYYKIPKIIRQQINYLWLLKLSSAKDLKLIISDFALGVEPDILVKMFNDATSKPCNLFKIDVGTSNLNEKFSINFTDFFKLNNEEKKEVKNSQK